MIGRQAMLTVPTGRILQLQYGLLWPSGKAMTYRSETMESEHLSARVNLKDTLTSQG